MNSTVKIIIDQLQIDSRNKGIEAEILYDEETNTLIYNNLDGVLSARHSSIYFMETFYGVTNHQKEEQSFAIKDGLRKEFYEMRIINEKAKLVTAGIKQIKYYLLHSFMFSLHLNIDAIFFKRSSRPLWTINYTEVEKSETEKKEEEMKEIIAHQQFSLNNTASLVQNDMENLSKRLESTQGVMDYIALQFAESLEYSIIEFYQIYEETKSTHQYLNWFGVETPIHGVKLSIDIYKTQIEEGAGHRFKKLN